MYRLTQSSIRIKLNFNTSLIIKTINKENFEHMNYLMKRLKYDLTVDLKNFCAYDDSNEFKKMCNHLKSIGMKIYNDLMLKINKQKIDSKSCENDDKSREKKYI